ncbi:MULTISPECIES: sugar-binding protein [Pasteurellaceae]|uniref:Sugar-binding protein n=1 Tax=Pasteurella atlantica TaxID=2827233 RepID=A0AAW8CH08_9PAST|nr:sugar-binding protein [Pasteurella atlantica]MBR0574298.1 hypothetical protein [Pasteurella atlantica]MDP8040202.1 sugar-binding protein [Pasteurella atlantica]MDP8042275.1 sugar-binding protein [Pasteurella atlantica]MDP8044508.1 sugar-binding protein [Pasteurella atlantica]MDP8046480.1 sugar-binding protein [Pasteurella atlantica]
MMKKFCIFFLTLLVAISYVNAEQRHITDNGKGSAQYDVIFIKNPTISTNKIPNEQTWQSIPEISGSLNYPWEAIQAPKTVFKAFHDGISLYFNFVVEDKDVLVEDGWKSDESTVDAEDRVEMFFAGTSVDQPDNYKLHKYYSVEVDAKGRVHDYSVEYYRHLDSKWNLKGLNTTGIQTEKGYIIQGSIPLESLRNLQLIREDNTMRVGVFRAEFSKTSSKETKMQWISWVDPNTTYPDFHVDSAFGVFRFLGL